MTRVSLIYIVHGSTGEYSDRREWVVEAYTTESAAQARITRLDELLREFGLAGDSFIDWEARNAAEQRMRDHAECDPHFKCDYTGTSYYMSQCPLVQP